MAGKARRIEGGVGPLNRVPAGWVIVGAAPIEVGATVAPAAGAVTAVGDGWRLGEGVDAGTWVTCIETIFARPASHDRL